MPAPMHHKFKHVWKVENISNRKNTHHSGEDVLIPNDVFLSKNALSPKAPSWTKDPISLLGRYLLLVS